MSVTRAGLPAFNAMDPDRARERLLICLDVTRWADAIVDGRPYASIGEIEAAMTAASATLTDGELEQALARHPRIGERADAAKHDAAHSTREQSGVDPDDADLARRLEEGNRAYEERFGHVFLIRAAGRSAEEMLAALTERLRNDPQTERDVVRRELADIVRLRLLKVVNG